MAHKANRVFDKLHNVPHLITQESFEEIRSFLHNRTNVVKLEDSGNDNEDNTDDSIFNPQTGIGVIDISGPLTYKPTGMQMLCGGTSYAGLIDQMQEMVDNKASCVILNVDSPGGAAYGMMETARQLRQMADDNSIRLVSYVDGMAASAGYGLACAGHEIVANPDATTGSVGVVVSLQNDSKALEKEGIERSFVYAGASKIPFAEDGSFRPEFIADIQSKVDALYENFTGFVSEFRGVSIEDVKATEAKTFMSPDALSLGLIDKQMTRQEFHTYLTQSPETPKELFNGEDMLSKMFSFKKKENTPEMANQTVDVNFDAAQLATLTAEFETKLADVAKGYEDRLASLKASLDEAQAQATAVKAEAQAKLDAGRKEQLSAVVSAEQLEAMFTATKGLGDAEFATIVAGMSASKEAEKANVLFQELGAATEDEAALEVDGESAEMKILKAKYARK